MKLSEAIKQIKDQFGKDVLTKERFVNILADMYPNRDNPALFGIIRTLVKDGYCSDLLAYNKSNVQTFISKSVLALNKKYGYDKTLVEETLNSLAAGSGVTVPKNINQPAPKPAPSKQTSQKPAKPQNHAPTKPTTLQTPAQQPKQNLTNTTGKFGWAFLILGFIGLFVSPIILLLYQGGVWGVFPFALLLIHALTILPCGLVLNRLRPNSWYGGLFSGMVLCAAFCLLLGFLDNDSELLALIGMSHHYESPSLITLLFVLLCVFGYLAAGSWGAHIAGIDTSPFFDDLFDSIGRGWNYSGGGKWLRPIGKSLSNRKFMIGVFVYTIEQI